MGHRWQQGGNSYCCKKRTKKQKTNVVSHIHITVTSFPPALSMSHIHTLIEKASCVSCYHQHFHQCPRQTVPVSSHVLNDSNSLSTRSMAHFSHSFNTFLCCNCFQCTESQLFILILDAGRCNQLDFSLTLNQLLSYAEEERIMVVLFGDFASLKQTLKSIVLHRGPANLWAVTFFKVNRTMKAIKKAVHHENK